MEDQDMTLRSHLNNMDAFCAKLQAREGIQAAAVLDVHFSTLPYSSTRAFFWGDPKLRKLLEIVPEGETWILKRPSPKTRAPQSVYLQRQHGIALAFAVDTGTPIIKSAHRILERSMRQLLKLPTLAP